MVMELPSKPSRRLMHDACASGVHNPFAMLEVFDCTKHMASGGIKDAPYIAGEFVPLIRKLEDMTDQFVSVVCY